ncbi:MAG: hypothetical protein EBR94_06200 [Bacteroidetes bacterium]|nr:hypothetical protein [Bacteroidota bacterium]
MNKRYDYIIQGAGASGLWLAYWMIKEGLLEEKRLLIVEFDPNKHNDRTWCFWGEEPIEKNWDFVNFSWNQVQIFGESQSIKPYTYHHCRSEAFYQFVKNALESSEGVDWCLGKVLEAVQLEGQFFVQVKIEGNLDEVYDVDADWFFGSGTAISGQEITLWQSFVGWRVKCNPGAHLFDSKSFRMMDFDIEQAGKTRFLYILPFGDAEALIEVTQFDKEILGLDEGQELLREICEKRNWEVLKMEVECNAIPMSSRFDSVRRFHKAGTRMIPLGVAAGALKPTTGYGFIRMMKHGKAIASALRSNDLIPTLYRKKRFRFYDNLLLRILQNHPTRGKQIFVQLFHHKKASMILRFLNEQTNLLQEIMIFMWLPKRLFIRNLIAKWKG